jgi:hypothetical protein
MHRLWQYDQNKQKLVSPDARRLQNTF